MQCKIKSIYYIYFIRATKPYETIYITAFMNETEDNERIVTYMAMDEYSSFVHPPIVAPSPNTNDELIGTLVKFYNSIIENYNPTIHAKVITFITHLPEPINDIFKAMIMPKDNLVSNPKKVKDKFQPIFKMME